MPSMSPGLTDAVASPKVKVNQGLWTNRPAPAPDALIPLTCNEIQRLFMTLVIRPVHDTAHRIGWSDWRRRHQARSQASHYRRQAAQI